MDKDVEITLMADDGYDKSEPETVLLHVLNTASTLDVSQAESEVKLWPNPVSSEFNISLGRTYSTIYYELLSLEGKVLRAETFYNTDKFYQYVDYPSGVYLIRLSSQGNLFSTQTLLIK